MKATQSKSIRRRYADFRKAGESAVNAIRSACIEEEFDRLESKGFVRIEIEFDDARTVTAPDAPRSVSIIQSVAALSRQTSNSDPQSERTKAP